MKKGDKLVSDDYEVGYGKPPKKNQFKKGKSGNPKGRPKKSRCPLTIIKEELDLSITVKEGNKTITMTKGEAVLKQMVNKAIKGDHRSALTVMEFMSNEMPDSEDGKPLGVNEQKILDDFFKQQNEKNDD